MQRIYCNLTNNRSNYTSSSSSNGGIGGKSSL